jgi:hypothetical protein
MSTSFYFVALDAGLIRAGNLVRLKILKDEIFLTSVANHFFMLR